MSEIKKENFTRITDYRPWGNYTVLADDNDHKVKKITVLAGQRLSLQRHLHRQEHWLVVSGRAFITLNDQQFELGGGESVDIPLGAIHRVENNSSEILVFIEVQLGDYFGEDDIERLEDDYGRS